MTQPYPLRIEIPPRRGNLVLLVRLVRLVRKSLHKNKQDAGECEDIVPFVTPNDQVKDGNGHPPVETLEQSVRDRQAGTRESDL
jgi:hypothetical protein